jgi:single-stranded-DNA-specific exonuclease
MGFYLKVAGVTFEGRQKVVAKLKMGDSLFLVREPNNPYDRFAIAIFDSSKEQIGYIPASNNGSLAYSMDHGHQYKVTVSSITGGGIDCSYGVNIFIEDK